MVVSGVFMKKAVLILCLLNIAVLGHSQDFTVAVTDFTARSGYSEEELENITELFAGFLLETKQVRVLTRSQWGAILKEYEFQFSGYVADSEIRRLGEALGAQAVITGTMMKLGGNNILNLSLLDIESGEMLSAARKTFASLDEFLDLLPALAQDVINLLFNKKTYKPVIAALPAAGYFMIKVFIQMAGDIWKPQSTLQNRVFIEKTDLLTIMPL
jgi:TolB-like protein